MSDRFSAGQTYEGHDGRTAIVVEIRDNGRAGLFRIDGDANNQEWKLYDEEFKAQWRLLGP
jgi:hypothetical protein